ncbi:hypothetical protein M9H77_09879 [Catharanthus roseus]|uniref:Uncharacterized protein n=1 Tax=Catharanthus roseus TaxID=4058 RepID=A0ACC0C281_CATRO|nr:hypothetical protein M9H77_09879 [Catharanthus roseus]
MLKYLDISFNDFNSSIPKGLYKCKSLESLNFGFNQLQGVISSDIGNLTSLTKLDLSYNAITGVPREIIGNLCKLEMLDLSENRIKASISEIIDEFYISGPIPSSTGKLSSLEDLSLDRNKLNGTIPETLWQLSRLNVLSIADNMLEGEVTQYQLDNLTSLTDFFASENHLVLKVNPTWNPIAQFYSLELGSWKLGSQFPLWLRSLKAVETLDLSLTGISGPIPSWFWNFSRPIKILNLSNNHLFGEISSIPNSMESFRLICLSSNQLSGPLPHVPANSVVELDLSNNSFTGDMSDLLCAVVEQYIILEILNLEGNLLFGEIPDCWINWPKLRIINLANNNLTGRIPESIRHLKILKSLDLHNNNLFGQIPITLKHCRELLKIDLGQNYLSGNLPTLLGSSLPRLRILILRSNRFHGNLAPEICFLTFLQIMDIAENNISGKIPNCFNNFSIMTGKMFVSDLDEVEEVDWFTNYRFIGYQESAYVATKGNKYKYDKNLAFFTSIDMSNNNFWGDIPEKLTELVRLRSLNLSGNHLSGNIPKNIGQMRQLESLDLSRNFLSGKIALSMSGMSFLEVFNLSYNNLSGEIPLSTQMQSFSAFSYIGNKLCGLPLTNRCTTLEDIPVVVAVVDENETSQVNWLYILMSLGYAERHVFRVEEKQIIQGAEDDDDLEFQDMKEKDYILLEKLVVIDCILPLEGKVHPFWAECGRNTSFTEYVPDVIHVDLTVLQTGGQELSYH